MASNAGRRTTPCKRQRGFTLVELLVGITLFALLTGAAYRGVQSVLDAHDRLERETRKWRELGFAFIALEQSLAVAADRPIRAADGRMAAAFRGGEASGDGVPLEFTRTGFPGHDGALGDAQRIGFRLRAGRLEQLLWPVLDRTRAGWQSEPAAAPLLSGVEAMQLRFLAREGDWHAAWPDAPGTAALPAAVEVTLHLSTGEQVKRLFALP